MFIRLRKESIGYGKFLYCPETKNDEWLMQHCMNEDLEALNEEGFDKLCCVAEAHGWKVEVN